MAKKRRFQPSRVKLDAAISDILDKAINADSANAPKQLHLILTSEHPEWKLAERRVAKYLKRQLKDRNDPKFNEIDADLDEVSIYSSTSSSWRNPAMTKITDPTEKKEVSAVETKTEESAKSVPEAASESEPAPESAEKAVTSDAYEDDNASTEKKEMLCEGLCIIL